MTLEIVLKNGKMDFLHFVESFQASTTFEDLYIVTFENKRQAFFNRSEVVYIGWKEDLCP